MSETNSNTVKAKRLKTKISLVIGAVLLVMLATLSGSLYEDVAADQICVAQVPMTGTLEFHTTPGAFFQKLSTLTYYDKSVQVWFSAKDNMGRADMDESIPIIFNDGGKGNISGSIRIDLPRSDKFLRDLHTTYGSMDNVIDELIIPSITKVIFTTGPLMTSYESYAAKKSDLIRYIEDQAAYGVYKTLSTEKTIEDELTGTKKTVTTAELIENAKSPNGFERQEASPMARFGIKVHSFAVDDIIYNKIIMDQIATQQRAKMQVETAIAEAKEAKQDAIKQVELGKAEAAKAKWAQEVIKAKQVTLAQQQFEVAQLNAKQALEEKKKVIAQGQAEAEKNRLKVAAGLTPQERAEWKFKTAVGVAEKMSAIKLPSVMIFGGDGKNGSPMDPFNAIGLESFMKIGDRLEAKSGTK